MNQGIRKIEIRIFGLTVVTIVIKNMNTTPDPMGAAQPHLEPFEITDVPTPWSDLAAAKRQEPAR